jgi:nucleoside-diphosphate-sugar epimerase
MNLGTGCPTSVNALVDMVLSTFGKNRDSYPVQYHPAQQGDLRASGADISLIKSVLSWTPKVSAEEGMPATIAWARKMYEKKV